MPEFQFISDNLNFFIVAALSLAAVLLVSNAVLLVLFLKFRAKLKAFFRGKSAADLESVLLDLSEKSADFERDLASAGEKLAFVEAMAKKGLHRVGVIRFNPYSGTGGDQSFVIAALDDANDGFVLSGLYSREGVRVYAKPVERGASRYPLSDEEKQAIEQAAGK